MTARGRGGLDGIVEALAWSDDAALARQLDDEFVATVSDRVEAAVPADVMAGLDALPAPSQLRLLRAPEVTRRVLFAHSPPPDAIHCLRQALAVEAAVAAGAPGPAGGWSALGDVWFEPDGILGRWPTLGEGAVPLDYGSPWVTRIDLTGREEFADRERPRPSPDTVSAVHHRITAAWRGLAAIDPTIVEFVRASTTVIVLQAHDDSPHRVSSGTNGIYVGRTFITNAHADVASVEALAEAIVHESIHGCLQRDVLDRPFTRASDDRPAITSPWTGRPLPVRAFLEASFVWFGLVQLWAGTTGREVFDADESRRLLLRAVRGFLAGTLVDRLAPWRDDVRPDLFELLDAMQDVVVAAVGTSSVA